MYAYGRPKARYLRETWMRVKDPETIREARLALGYTQRDLAGLAKCSQAAISAIERGDMKGCSDDLAAQLCKWLRLTERALFVREGSVRVARVTNAAGSRRQQVAA